MREATHASRLAARPELADGSIAADAGQLLVREAQRFASTAGHAAAWSLEARRAALASVDRVMGLLAAARGDLLVAEKAAGSWRQSGDPSFEAWRGRTSRTGVGAARRDVQQAETATQLPAIRAAVAEGSTTTAHLDALATVVARAPQPVRDALAAPATQEELVDAARRLDSRAFATAAARIAARVDPVAHERSHQAQRAARFLHLTETPDGTRLSGQLDVMAGHRLRLALEAASPRPALDDERTPEQRRADALGVLAENVLADPGTTTGASVRPHVSFHMSAETWVGLKAVGAARAGAAGGAGRRLALDDPAMAGLDAVAPGRAEPVAVGHGTVADVSFEPVTLDDGTPVPLSEAARALCDCELTRVVMDAAGAVLDVGRTQRTYTGVQRRAVVSRDRGCAWAGCGAQARWCEVHHIRWWDRDGGETSVENGVLLCSFHHHEVHRRDLSIERHRPDVRDEARGASGARGDDEPPGPDGAPRRDRPPPGPPRYIFRDPGGRTVSGLKPERKPTSTSASAPAPAQLTLV